VYTVFIWLRIYVHLSDDLGR